MSRHKGSTLSEEHKRKISEAHKGKKGTRLGIKMSDEQKMKIGKSKSVILGVVNYTHII